MKKFSLCIFTIAVLLGGAASDFSCILRQFYVVRPDNFFYNPISSCQDVEEKFEGVRKELRKCTHHEVKTSYLESIYSNLCDLNTVFREKFDRQERCLSRSILSIKTCTHHMLITSQLNPYTLTRESQIYNCSGLSQEVSRYLKVCVGKPCGREGIEVYGRMAEASEPFIKGMCLEASDSALRVIETLDEVVTAESGIMEVVDAEGASTDVKCDQYAGAAANTAVYLSIILGLLFTVKW